MNAEELAAIKARAEAATPGPWQWTATKGEDDHLVSLAVHDRYGQSLEVLGTSEWLRIEPPNATFIAHARTDVPAILAEVKRLRAVLLDIASLSDADSGHASVLAERALTG